MRKSDSDVPSQVASALAVYVRFVFTDICIFRLGGVGHVGRAENSNPLLIVELV